MNLKTKLLTLALGAGIVGAANGQVSIAAFNVSYTENFDSFDGTSGTVPSNFTFSDSDYTPGGIYDSAGSYVNSNSNYALIDSSLSLTDRAFGQKGPTSGTDFLNWSFVNNTGTTISQFTVSWDFEQYSEAGRATELSFNYNPNSEGWTTIGITGSNSSTATTNAIAQNLSPLISESKSVTIDLDTALNDGEGILFGWGFASGSGSGSNAHIGIDNTSVTAVPEPSTYGAIFGLLALGFAIARRRRQS